MSINLFKFGGRGYHMGIILIKFGWATIIMGINAFKFGSRATIWKLMHSNLDGLP